MRASRGGFAALFLLLVAGGCLEVPRGRYSYRALRAARAVAEETDAEAGPGPRAARDGAQRLSLTDAIRLALANNPDMEIALERVRQAAARSKEASAPFLPSVSFDTSYLRADAPSAALFKGIDARTFEPGTDFNNPGTFENFETGFSARYNLFRGGRDVLERWIAQSDATVSRLDHDALTNALVAGVSAACFDMLLSAELVRAAVGSVETVRAQRRETEARFRAGRVLRSDVLSLEVRLAEAEETAIRAENTRKLAMARLATLLGEGAGTELEVVDAEWEDTTLPEGYGDALAEALAARPELARARASVERAALGLSAAKRAFLPSVDAEARAYWDDADLEYRGDRTNWFLGVSLNWTLFEGGRRRAALERAGAFYRELLGADRKQVLAIESEVRSATLRLAEARARVRVTQASEAQAEEGLELVRKQYEGGAAGITRYLEAELALTRSRVRRASATIDLGKARAELARAIGRFAPARANHER